MHHWHNLVHSVGEGSSRRRNTKRFLALTMSTVLIAAGLVGMSVPVSATPPNTPSTTPISQPSAQSGDWREPDQTVDASPAKLAEDVDPGEKADIVVVTEGADKPIISKVPVKGPQAAKIAIANAQKDSDLLSVDVDVTMRTFAPDAAADAPTLANDRNRPLQWALNRLKAETLWAQGRKASVDLSKVKVAVLDSGIDGGHPDLRGVLTKDGRDYVQPGGDGTNPRGDHGTLAAGVIAAHANNNIGIAGLASGAKITSIRVTDAAGYASGGTVAQGIMHAADTKADVINLSLGGPVNSYAVVVAIEYAIKKGAIVVAAAGNDRLKGNPIEYPASLPAVISVGATDQDDKIGVFSNTNGFVDVAGPGVNILSTTYAARYAYADGTSFATPYVAAAAAYLKAGNPKLQQAEVERLLRQTATDLGPKGRDDAFGWGLVDPVAAFNRAILNCTGDNCTPSDPSKPDPEPKPPVVAKIPTRTDWLKTPAVVGYGATVRATAELRNSETNEPLSKQPVTLCRKAKAAKSFTCTKTTTDAKGRATLAFKATGHTMVYGYHLATARTAVSTSARPEVRVRPVARLVPGKRAVSTRITPARTQRVTLQRFNGRTWVVQARKNTTRAGRVAFTRLPKATYRLQIPATATLVAYTTPQVRVTR